MKTKDVLYAFDENHDPPTDFIRSFPLQTHFDQRFEVPKDSEDSCKPLVLRVLFDPCARVPRVGSGWDEGFVFGIRLYDPVEQRVMVQTDRVQQRSH